MINNIWLSALWVLAASLLGFGISAVFSAWIKLSRRVFLIPYIGLTSLFLFLFFRVNEIDLFAFLVENWIWGLVAGVAVGAFLVNNVRSQPSSQQFTGSDLALDIGWLGLAYGIIDALFLNVMPVQSGRSGSLVVTARRVCDRLSLGGRQRRAWLARLCPAASPGAIQRFHIKSNYWRDLDPLARAAGDH